MISPSEYSTDEQELVEFSPLAIQVVSALATKHGVALRKFAESIYNSANTRFDVDDMLQLSWMEVMRRLDIGNLTFNEGDPLPALCTIVRQTRASLVKSNTQKLRDFSMETTVDDDSVDVTVPPTVDTILTTEVKEVVRDGITLLEDDDREVIELSHIENLKNADVADLLNISEPAVRKRCQRARTRLFELLKHSHRQFLQSAGML